MRPILTALFVVAVAACGRIGFDPELDGPGDIEPGDIFDTGVFRITSLGDEASNPALYWNGDHAGLVFEHNSRIGAHRLEADGTVMAAMTEMNVDGRANRPQVAAIGKDYGVVFDDGGGDARTVYLSRFGNTSSVPVRLGAGRALSASIAVRDDSDLVGVAWRRDQSGSGPVVFVEFAPDGSIPSPIVIEGEGDNHEPDLAACPSGYGMVWSHKTPSGAKRVMFAQIDSQGNAMTRVIASDTIKHAKVAWDGDAWVVVWTDTSGDEQRLMMSRVSTELELVLDATPILPSEAGAGVPAIATSDGDGDGDGEIVFAVRGSGSAVWFHRVDRDGVAIDQPKKLYEGDNANLPSIVRTSAGYLGVWQADVDRDGKTELYGRAFRP